MDAEIAKFFLPEDLLKYFNITKIEELEGGSIKEKRIQIELEEKNQIPEGYDGSQYESKGFTPALIIQDFPIRGKAVYLSIKRRRWRNKENKNEVIQNDYSIVAEGSKLTKELSDFLKGTGRDPRRYSK
jgi:hypothetical protein